jgi:hypothetical protein
MALPFILIMTFKPNCLPNGPILVKEALMHYWTLLLTTIIFIIS